MAKWRVTYTDGRTMEAYAPDEAGALSQAEHADRSRFVIAVKRGQDPGPSPCVGVSATKVKD